jgi:hypothetical protein
MIKAINNKGKKGNNKGNNKNIKMKPVFLSLKKFEDNYLECDNERIIEFININVTNNIKELLQLLCKV